MISTSLTSLACLSALLLVFLFAPVVAQEPQTAIKETLAAAVRAARDIAVDKERAYALASIGGSMVRSGERNEGKNALDEAIRIALRLSPKDPTDATQLMQLQCVYIASETLCMEDWKWTQSYMEDVIRQAWTKELKFFTAEDHHQLFLSGLALRQAAAGQQELAIATAASIRSPFHRDGAYASCAKLRAQAKDWSGSLSLIEKISTEEKRAQAMVDHGLAQSQAGQKSKAKESIDQAERTLATTKAVFVQPLHQALALAYAEIGETDKALELARSIRNISTVVPSREDTISAVYLKSGDFAKAKEFAFKARDIASNYEAPLYKLAVTMTEGKRFADAAALSDEMKNPYTRTPAMLSLAKAQYQQGNKAEAAAWIGKALAIAKTIEPSGGDFLVVPSQLFSQIAHVQAEGGDENSTRRWIDGLQDSRDRAWALKGMAEGLLARKSKEGRP
jgi:tetratricopeptide (TPR) repeat protein